MSQQIVFVQKTILLQLFTKLSKKIDINYIKKKNIDLIKTILLAFLLIINPILGCIQK